MGLLKTKEGCSLPELFSRVGFDFHKQSMFVLIIGLLFNVSGEKVNLPMRSVFKANPLVFIVNNSCMYNAWLLAKLPALLSAPLCNVFS